MEDIIIRKIDAKDKIPYELLLLADPSINVIKEYISRGDIYIACIDNDIVGVCVLIKTRPFTLELVNISISESYQNCGIGKKLINYVIYLSKKDNAKVLEVGTGNSSIYQLALYQKCGFRIVGVDKDFFKKHYEEKIMENGIECIDMIRLSIDL